MITGLGYELRKLQTKTTNLKRWMGIGEDPEDWVVVGSRGEHAWPHTWEERCPLCKDSDGLGDGYYGKTEVR